MNSLIINEGAYAFINGESPDNNPYPKGSSNFKDWLTGYDRQANSIHILA